MTRHLTPDQVIAVLEGTALDARVGEHLAGCGECRTQVESLRAIAGDLHASDPLPEPSPLFWDHFSARVRQATQDEVVGQPRWWEARRWSLVAAACVATVLAVTLSVRGPQQASPSGPVSDSVAAGVAATADAATADESRWDDVVQMAAQLSVEDVGGVAPTMETATLVEDLTPQERAAFLKLLTVEMERTQ